jgi:protein kinase-like protein
MHVTRHMEEIALSVLPRDEGSDKADEEDEYDSSDRDSGTDAFADEHEPRSENKQQTSMKSPSKWDLERFYLRALLGQGNFARIILVQSKETNRLYAMRTFSKRFLIANDEFSSIVYIKRAMRMATQSQFPFIARLEGISQTESHVLFFTEYCAGGDLMHHIQKGPFSMDQSR